MILRMLENPIELLRGVCRNEAVKPIFKRDLSHGCNITLAGYGYPFVQLSGPIVPVQIDGEFDCDVFWNEVGLDEDGILCATGHRISDVVALGSSMAEAIAKVYENIAKIRCLGSYYRTDVGESLWPPGTV